MGKSSYKLDLDGIPVKGKIEDKNIIQAVSSLFQKKCDFISLQSPTEDFLQAAWTGENCLTVEYHKKKDSAVILYSNCNSTDFDTFFKIFFSFFKADGKWKSAVPWQKQNTKEKSRKQLKALPVIAVITFLLGLMSFICLPAEARLAVIGVTFFILYIIWIYFVFISLLPRLKKYLEIKFQVEIQDIYWIGRAGRESWIIIAKDRPLTIVLLYLLYFTVLLSVSLLPVAALTIIVLIVS